MTNKFDIQEYMTKGAERVIREALKAVFTDPKETLFLTQFAASMAIQTSRRRKYREAGKHVPAFLIASITSACNLHCAGCYSRYNHATVDAKPERQLSSKEWEAIFKEAEDIGISFILLAGGEPLLRRDVIRRASAFKSILFPIFTNGVYVDEEFFDLFRKNRNLLPILSIEGDETITDERRGEGIYAEQMGNMEAFRKDGILFGISITVTKENYDTVTGLPYIREMEERGCKVIIYVEYVPVSDDTLDLAIGDEEREIIRKRINDVRSSEEPIVLVSFPGDEKSSDGCIAAGRGFFHINSHGEAEPCPFSPYSDLNVKDTGLLVALDSKLFRTLREGDYLKEDHKGGCVLFERREEVKRLL